MGDRPFTRNPGTISEISGYPENSLEYKAFDFKQSVFLVSPVYTLSHEH